MQRHVRAWTIRKEAENRPFDEKSKFGADPIPKTCPFGVQCPAPLARDAPKELTRYPPVARPTGGEKTSSPGPQIGIVLEKFLFAVPIFWPKPTITLQLPGFGNSGSGDSKIYYKFANSSRHVSFVLLDCLQRDHQI